MFVPPCVHPPPLTILTMPEPSPVKKVAASVPITCNFAVGLQVPMPTLPFITVNPPAGVTVPIPILPDEDIKNRSPSDVAALEIINGALAACLTISRVVDAVVVPMPTKSVVVVL